MKAAGIAMVICSLLGTTIAVYSFRDRQIEVEYGTKIKCYKCSTVIKAPKKKIIWASKRDNYEVEVEEGCCDKCKVEVEVGEIVTCEKCGKTVLNSLTTIRVDPREKTKYSKTSSQARCNECSVKPVVWGKGVEGFTYKYSKFCPHCGSQVPWDRRFDTCRDCGKGYRHVPSPPCPNCDGLGQWQCTACKGAGLTKSKACFNCNGKGEYYEWLTKKMQKCHYCKGKGHHVYSCNGDGTGKTASCRSGKMYCQYCDGRGTIN